MVGYRKGDLTGIGLLRGTYLRRSYGRATVTGGSVCAILEAVRALVRLVSRKGVRHAVTGILCALLLFFAVGNKLAWYHPHEAGAKSVAATKAWQTTDTPASSSEQTKIVPQSLVMLALLLTAFPVAVSLLPRRSGEAAVFLPSSGFSPFAVRPPPAC